CVLPLAAAFVPGREGLGSRVAAGALGIAWAGLLWGRFARVGVYPSSDGVRIVNLLRTYRLKTSQVHAFALGPSWVAGVRGLSGLVERTDGPVIEIYGITCSGRPKSRSYQEGARLIAELNKWLDHAHGQGRGPDETTLALPWALPLTDAERQTLR